MTDSLRSLPDNILYVSFLPGNEKTSQTTIGAWTDTSRVFLDDIKVFEPSEEGDSTVELTADATDRCERTKLHVDFRLIGTQHERKSPKITTPRSAYLKMRDRLTP